MNISKIRSLLYTIARYLGDFNAVKKAIQTGNLSPIIKRIFNKIYGRITGRGYRK